MTRDELQNKLQFLTSDTIEKSISVFVTTSSTSLQLFNIENNDLDELKEAMITSVKDQLIENDYTIEDYSTTLERENVLYRYDLGSNTFTPEMNNMFSVLQHDGLDRFDTNHSSMYGVNGQYTVIRGNDNDYVVLYKLISNIEKTYVNSSFLFFHEDTDMFRRQRKPLLTISTSIHMLMVGGQLFLINLKKLEKPLHLDSVIQREAQRDIQSIMNRGLIVDDDMLQRVCSSTSKCKKLKHAMNYSKVFLNSISNSDIIAFALSKTNKLRFHFNEDRTKFDLKSKSEGERFIKLLDDDYLYSQLTLVEYDSEQKKDLILDGNE